MQQLFGLAEGSGTGVACNETGLFVGDVPLLERNGDSTWRPRPLVDLNQDLSKCYGLPVEISPKIDGLAAVARALGHGALARAQIVTLHLRLPEPPALAKSAQSLTEILGLANRLKASGLLKAEWDPAKHPRWPAKSPDGTGGEFAPGGSVTGASLSGEPAASLIPAQITIPFPLEIPDIPGFPIPSEVGVPPLVAPKETPRNPFPDRPECVEEWEHAYKFCRRLKEKGQLGRGDYGGMGRTMRECLLGQVSADCGGYPTVA